MNRPTLGVSSCLLGQEVRYDGGHKHNDYVTKTLAEFFDFVPFCPERAIGLPVPRPPIRLIRNDSGIRAVEISDPSNDYTRALDGYAKDVVQDLQDFSGYIVKKDSPSCGMERVKVYGKRKDAPPARQGAGIYTAGLMKARPELPIEEEGRLMDPRLRENFISRVFVMSRWREMINEGLSKKSLLSFHSRHKFLLLAHHEDTYRQLGRLVSDLGTADLESIATDYIQLLMQGMRHLVTAGKHANVLMHIMGFVKDRMTADEKVEMLDLIDSHRQGLVPIIVPITLLNHFLKCYPHEYIDKQYFLEPHPRELMLRNSI